MRFGTGTGQHESSNVRQGGSKQMRQKGIGSAVLIGVAVMLAGCGTPSAVMPLMRSAEQAIQRERELLKADRARQAKRFEQQRETLRTGYEADLQSRDAIDADWVMEGTRAYVTAREALLRQEMELNQQNETRRRNLSLAADALARAAGLIRQQDQLLGPANPWPRLETSNGNGRSLPGDPFNAEEDQR